MADIRINSLPSTATSFNTDDYIAIDGASGGTRKMLAANPPFSDVTLGTSGPSVKSSLSARAPRQGLVFDGTFGATSTAKFSAGSAHTLHGWITPTTSDVYRAIFSNRTGGGSTNGVLISRAPSGAIAVYQANATPADVPSTGTAPINKTTAVTVVFDGSSVKIYLNGVLDTSTNVSGYPTGLFDLELGVDGAGGVQKWIGGMSGALIYNRALSASEVVSLYEAGAPAGADYNSASNTNAILNVSRNSDFSAGATDWGSLNGATISVVSSTLNVVASAAGQVASLASSYFGGNFKVGKRYRLTFTVSNFSSGDTLRVSLGGSNQVVADAVNPNGTYTYEWTASGSDGTFLFFSPVNGARTYNLDNIAIYPLGLLLAPDAAQAGGGLVWYDTSGNAANITLPASGVSWNVPSSRVLGGNWTTSGTLTISGGQAVNIGSSANYNLWKDATPTKAGRVILNNTVTNGLSLGLYDGSSWVDTLHIHPTNNNVLIGTTSDSANGKLQLATHTTSTGGIGFGSDTALYRSGDPGRLAIDHLGGTDALLFFRNSGTARGLIEAYGTGSTFYMGSASSGWKTVIMSGNSADALTLDSSQNATFAGSVKVNSANGIDINSGGTTAIFSQSVSGVRKNYLYFDGTNTILGSDTGSVQFSSNSGIVKISSSQALQLGNAYVAGAPTATGYVTIKDSNGTTYKVLVGT